MTVYQLPATALSLKRYSGRDYQAPGVYFVDANLESSTLRVAFTVAAGTTDNIKLTADNELRFYQSSGKYDPIAAITV